MSHRDFPEAPARTHLRLVGASDLPRRVLDAAAREVPSPELTRRMEKALGISMTASAAAATAAKTATATGKSAGAGAGVTSTVIWSSIAIGVVVLAVTGAIVGVRLSRHDQAASKPATTGALATQLPTTNGAAPSPAVTDTPITMGGDPPYPPAQPVTMGGDPPYPPAQPVAVEVPPAPVAPSVGPAVVDAPAPPHHGTTAAAPSDLRAEIALIDAARSAVMANTNDRALTLLQLYEATYPSGTFRPEATALRVEALEHLGHTAQARALAQKFIAAHADSPLAKRVARAAGIDSH